jgi:hypothetical protein
MNDFDAHTVQNYRVVAGRAARRFANTRISRKPGGVCLFMLSPEVFEKRVAVSLV